MIGSGHEVLLRSCGTAILGTLSCGTQRVSCSEPSFQRLRQRLHVLCRCLHQMWLLDEGLHHVVVSGQLRLTLGLWHHDTPLAATAWRCEGHSPLVVMMMLASLGGRRLVGGRLWRPTLLTRLYRCGLEG